MVPDIRIEIEQKTIAIIEIKSKVGWIQSFFSTDRMDKDRKRRDEGRSSIDPDEEIRKVYNQIWKYINHFQIEPSMFFVLVPSLKQAHRKKYNRNYKYYKSTFSTNSGLRTDNLVILTDDLSYEASNLDQANSVTSEFDYMIHRIANHS